jgi:hypothetical protein
MSVDSLSLPSPFLAGLVGGQQSDSLPLPDPRDVTWKGEGSDRSVAVYLARAVEGPHAVLAISGHDVDGNTSPLFGPHS